MQKRQFGSTAREVAVIGQGTWFIEQGEPSATVAALRRGLDLGMTHIDSAELYGSGAAEELVSQASPGVGTKSSLCPRCSLTTPRAAE